MSTPIPGRRIGRPPRIVKDQARADSLLRALERAERLFRETNEERVRLALQAYETGLTMEAIARVLGVSERTVSNWIRAASAGASSHKQ
ncbi:helix-turn-helix domain-containing protein [Curtobacterium sp. SAFR-003]|uniref:helix-turn-helix domain-containing protein n=1 Tax=Curtobacterium sp. SAFR-003 TaxID=3387276 RepID=UPI003F7CFC91